MKNNKKVKKKEKNIDFINVYLFDNVIMKFCCCK